MKSLLIVLLSMSLGVAFAETTPAVHKKAETTKAAPAKKAEAAPAVKHHKKVEGTEIPSAPAKK